VGLSVRDGEGGDGYAPRGGAGVDRSSPAGSLAGGIAEIT